MKLSVPFVQLPLQFDASLLAREVDALDASLWRPHPSGLAGNDALPLVARDGDPQRGDALLGAMRPTPALLRCRYLSQVMASLGAVIGRVRLMRLAPGAEVDAHVDTNHYWNERVRVHIPIETNPSVEFYCGDAHIHMAAGECWVFDTWRLHRVTNVTGPARIHLVVDTVGSPAFVKLLDGGRPPGGGDATWVPRVVAPAAGDALPDMMFESVNLMSPMTYWELRGHVEFLLSECEEQPMLPVVQYFANQFVLDWRALWFRYGDATEGRDEFRSLLHGFLAKVQQVGRDIALRNGVQLAAAFNGLLGEAARGGQNSGVTEEAARTPRYRASANALPPDYAFDRPVFIVSPPRSGSSLLFETLAQAPGVCTIGGESHGIIEGQTAGGRLGAAARGYASNRLDASAAEPELAAALRNRFRQRAFDRDGQHRSGQIRLLEKTPKNALRIPFFDRVFPDAVFVYLYRDPRQVMASMLEAWESGGFRTYPQLPGWTGLPWSMTLVSGWRDLIGRPLPEVVAAQWRVITETLLDDLAALPPTRWHAVRYDRFTAEPEREVHALCNALGLGWDRSLASGLPIASHTVSPPDNDKWRRREPDIAPWLESMAALVTRAERAADHV